MKIEQLFNPYLAQTSYYIESNTEAAVIDPLRDTQPYLTLAHKGGATIKYVFLTHLHNDFVSGQVELAQKTGATIILGPGTDTRYEKHVTSDNEILRLGATEIKVIHTPGHTVESCCLLLHAEDGKPYCVFTGDTLFIGGTPIPDLAQADAATEDYLAGMLYDSLRGKLLPLPDTLLIYPGHGAGSLCGKHIGAEKSASLGEQKASNPALLIQDRQEFINNVTTGMPPVLPYFRRVAALNKQGCADLETVMQTAATPLAPRAVKAVLDEVLVLDVRSAREYSQGFIPGALNIGLDGLFEIWAGTLLADNQQRLVIVAPPGREREALVRLSAIGCDATSGFLKGGIASWSASEAVDTIESISAQQLAQIFGEAQSAILDCRMPFEFNAGHVTSAVPFPLSFIHQRLNDLDRETTYYLHCQSGYRSMIAASILRRHGYRNVVDIHDGFDALLKTGLPVTG